MKSAYAFLIYVSVVVALAGCRFEPSLTPIVWPTYPVGGGFGEVRSTPLPYPSPTSPFLNPGAPVPFQGAGSLNCAEPQGGDNHFGYCLVLAGNGDVYTWGECAANCPDGPYPGIEILRVPSADSAIFRDVIDKRDAVMAARQQGTFRGRVLGGLGATLGIRGAAAVCLASAGWGCALAVGAVVVDLVIAWDESRQGREADARLNAPTGLEFSAEDQFRQLREEHPPETELLP